MARAHGVVFGLLAAAAIARGSITVSWNTHAAPPRSSPVRERAAFPLRSGIVESVRGTHVVLRLHDGTTHAFIAPAEQAHTLEKLVGTEIQFRSP